MSQIPLPTPISAVPEGDLTPSQWEVLFAICDAVIPAIHGPVSEDASQYHSPDGKGALVVPPGTSADIAQQYLSEKPSDIPGFREVMRLLLFTGLAESDRTAFIRVLDVLSYSVGSLALTGSLSFAKQPTHVRDNVLKSWSQSRLPPLRLLYRQFVALTKQVWTRTSPTLRPLIGFPRTPVDCKLADGFDFNFIQFPPNNEPEVLETDVVVVGSGCGGGVAAKVLSEAGLRVLVVDKGYYWPPEYLPMTEEHGPPHFLQSGGFMTDDGSVALIAAETWGGGGTINWSASLQVQGFVRRQWADTGIPFFTSTKFQESIDRVCDTMGVTAEDIPHTIPNKKLLEGSRRLGWAHKEVPQNTGHSRHSCGHCFLGCRSGEKQGPTVSWLPKAAAAGARFIEGFNVERVLFDKIGGELTATGVEGSWRSRDLHLGTAAKSETPRRVMIKAKKVIVSCGTLQSPLLLRRSGLRNPQIGRNLYLHPVSVLGAIYDEETVPWDGPILSTVCSEFENLDGHGHGVKLETTSMLPYSWLSWAPRNEGREYKRLAARMRHMGGFISISRDRDTGRVYPDPADGRTRVEYTPSKFDKDHVLEGLVGLARINYAAGARELFTMVEGLEAFVRAEGEDEEQAEAAFEAWVKKLRLHGFPAPETLFVSAHQMGTCRMSATPKKGVVDPTGQVWGTKGLYVMDASVFPTASGVNPMVTNMSIADFCSRGIVESWTREKL